VDILTANGVGGGSLIYSGVNKESEQSRYKGWPIALETSAFDSARKWMASNCGALSSIVVKIPSYQDFKQKWGPDLTTMSACLWTDERAERRCHDPSGPHK
jgi:hypothetical protein